MKDWKNSEAPNAKATISERINYGQKEQIEGTTGIRSHESWQG
jgi:hypothetical protein